MLIILKTVFIQSLSKSIQIFPNSLPNQSHYPNIPANYWFVQWCPQCSSLSREKWQQPWWPSHGRFVTLSSPQPLLTPSVCACFSDTPPQPHWPKRPPRSPILSSYPSLSRWPLNFWTAKKMSSPVPQVVPQTLSCTHVPSPSLTILALPLLRVPRRWSPRPAMPKRSHTHSARRHAALSPCAHQAYMVTSEHSRQPRAIVLTTATIKHLREPLPRAYKRGTPSPTSASNHSIPLPSPPSTRLAAPGCSSCSWTKSSCSALPRPLEGCQCSSHRSLPFLALAASLDQNLTPSSFLLSRNTRSEERDLGRASRANEPEHPRPFLCHPWDPLDILHRPAAPPSTPSLPTVSTHVFPSCSCSLTACCTSLGWGSTRVVDL